MKTQVLRECGYEEAMLGLSLSYGKKPEDMPKVACKLAHKGDGHNKFLESMVVWLDIRAPRYWWQQFDTYRVGTTKQSESTMHTLLRRQLLQSDFAVSVQEDYLEYLNGRIRCGDFDGAKKALPESFMQRRVVCTNYMVLQRMFRQRRSHKLREWGEFLADVLSQAKYPDFIYNWWGSECTEF
jgi:hypothetical protein